MKTRILTLSLILAFSLLNLSNLYSQQMDKPLFKYKQERVIEKLNLSDEQSDKISDLRTRHQRSMIDLRADLDKAKLDLKELRKSSDFNRSKMISATEKISGIKNKIALEKANHQMDIYELLTPDQKKTWQEHQPIRFRGEGRLGFRGDGKFKRGGLGFGPRYCW